MARKVSYPENPMLEAYFNKSKNPSKTRDFYSMTPDKFKKKYGKRTSGSMGG